jgi:predicted O-methyltransferase YrrM
LSRSRARSDLRRLALRLPALKRLVGERDELRATARHRDGVLAALGHPPGHYYSPVPSFDEIEQRADRIWGPPPRELPGIELNLEGQLRVLAELSRYAAEQPFSDGPDPTLRYHFDNDMYGKADGAVMYAMLRHLRPNRVVEVGSGYTSALMLDTLGPDTGLTFIDPEPHRLRTLLRPGDEERATMITQPVQEVSPEAFTALAAGDLLFVDSSHVTKTGSDVNHIVFELLPRISPGVYVHFHDAFYPFEYPRSFIDKRWAWNELYLLRGFLEYNRQFEVVLWPSYLEAVARDTLAERLPLAVTPSIWPDVLGASLWLRKVPER